MIESIYLFLIDLLDKVGPLGVFIASFVESIFPPIPSEVIMFTAGSYAKSQAGISTLIIVCIAGSLGNFFGTLPFYLISRIGSETILPKFINKWGKYLLIEKQAIDKSHKYFEEKGNQTVFLAKLIPGIRSLIAIPAGIAKMDFKKYFLLSFAGSFVWNLILASLGYFAYDQKDAIFQGLKPIENVVLVILGIVAIVYLYKVVRRNLQTS